VQCSNSVEVMLETVVTGTRCIHTRGWFICSHIFIMDFLFEANKAVPSVRIQMSLLVFCNFEVPQLAEHLSDTFPDIYPLCDINNRRGERHDINLSVIFVRSYILSLKVSVNDSKCNYNKVINFMCILYSKHLHVQPTDVHSCTNSAQILRNDLEFLRV